MYDIMKPFLGSLTYKERRFQHTLKQLAFLSGLHHASSYSGGAFFVQTSTIVSKVGSLKSQIQELLQRPSDYSFLQAHTNGVVV